MKERSPFHPSRLAPIAALLLMSGCAAIDKLTCDMHESSTRGMKPVTTYAYIAPKAGQPSPRPLPRGSVPHVSTYTMTFKPGFTKPCATLTLYKDVAFERSDDTDNVLTEIREFYAEDGTLITSYTQDITAQTMKSGVYVATTPLPVPKSAPPGKYKIVSKLLFEKHGSRRPAVQLARAEGFFYIIPLQ